MLVPESIIQLISLGDPSRVVSHYVGLGLDVEDGACCWRIVEWALDRKEARAVEHEDDNFRRLMSSPRLNTDPVLIWSAICATMQRLDAGNPDLADLRGWCMEQKLWAYGRRMQEEANNETA